MHLIRDLTDFIRYSTEHRRNVRLCRRSNHLWSDRTFPPCCTRCWETQ